MLTRGPDCLRASANRAWSGGIGASELAKNNGSGRKTPRSDTASEHGTSPENEMVGHVRDALAIAKRTDRRFVAYLLEMVLIELIDPTR